jgi:hypothetical protein
MMEMRSLLFEGEAYCDEGAQEKLIKRTIEAISLSGTSLEALEVSANRDGVLFLVKGEAAAIRRLWGRIEATGLENAWEDFGSRLDWQPFQLTSKGF